jgi:hypothetical protein
MLSSSERFSVETDADRFLVVGVDAFSKSRLCD